MGNSNQSLKANEVVQLQKVTIAKVKQLNKEHGNDDSDAHSYEHYRVKICDL